MTETGTREAEWAGWPALERLPRLQPPAGRVLVVSAHPDDEVLGAGGLIASLAARHARLSFLTVTDGEASHPDAPTALLGRLPELRSRELVAALEVLGVVAPDVTRLHLPDSGIAAHRGRLAAAVAPYLDRADVVVCPSAIDGHADHETVGQVVREACRGRVPIVEFPVWMWHWTKPGDQAIPWHQAYRLDLTGAEQRAKQRALACFATQVSPWPDSTSGTTMLPPNVLAHFLRMFEVFFT